MDEYLSRKITILRPLLIIMIILNHSPTVDSGFPVSPFSSCGRFLNIYTQTFLGDGVARVAVPLFSMISGFLFFRDFDASRKFFKSKIRKRISTLLMPYLLYSFLCLIFYYFMHTIPITAKLFQAERLLPAYSFSELLNVLLVNPIPGQLWFVRDLFIFAVFSPIIYWFLRYIGPSMLAVLAAIWFCSGNESIYHDTLLAKNMEVLLFFSTGAFFSLNKINVKFKVQKPLFIFLLWLILLGIKTYCAVMLHNRFTDLHRLAIIVGMAAVWLNYDKIEHFLGKLLYSFSLYTFPVFLFHAPMLQVFRRVARAIADGSELLQLAGYFICASLAIGGSVLLAYLLRNILPKAYSIIVGSRLTSR